jgi:hypothetical protein
VLALNLLIAQGDDRLIAISPRGQVVWRKHQADPGQVFVSHTGRTLVIAEPQADVVVLRRVDSGAVSFFFGRRHRPGSGRNRLDDPQTAIETATGSVAIADSGNCRILLVAPGAARARQIIGRTGVCVHSARPLSFADPDSALAAARGQIIVTERSAGRVDVLSGTGRLVETIAVKGFTAASDASMFAGGRIVVADRTDPGRVDELDAKSGALLWRYGPATGPGALDDPAMASVLANGDVLVVDSGNDRVVVIDRQTGAIVWQYGHTGVSGRTPGYLDDPLSATLVPIGGG